MLLMPLLRRHQSFWLRNLLPNQHQLLLRLLRRPVLLLLRLMRPLLSGGVELSSADTSKSLLRALGRQHELEKRRKRRERKRPPPLMRVQQQLPPPRQSPVLRQEVKRRKMPSLPLPHNLRRLPNATVTDVVHLLVPRTPRPL
jgi:hypothetical protein